MECWNLFHRPPSGLVRVAATLSENSDASSQEHNGGGQVRSPKGWNKFQHGLRRLLRRQSRTVIVSTGRLHGPAGRLFPLIGEPFVSTGRLYGITGKLHGATGRLHWLTGRLHWLTGRLFPLTGERFAATGRLEGTAGRSGEGLQHSAHERRGQTFQLWKHRHYAQGRTFQLWKHRLYRQIRTSKHAAALLIHA